MSGFPIATPVPVSSNPLQTRSLGVKLFLIIALAAVLSLPAIFLDGMVDQRAVQHGASQSQASAQPTTVLQLKLGDSYRSVNRSLKYVTLFLGLVFLTYFLFEVQSGARVHPGQYALVGVAQIIFYLLLLSLAEIVGFDWGFLIAGAATVTLLAWNAGWVLGAAKKRWQSLGIFSLLYGFIYMLLRLENYALLVGATASFCAVAAAMYFTRNVDWYTGEAAMKTSGAVAPGVGRESWLD